ncbi:hypothetical protein [Nocardiopsis protaetiae]|uniref:hypothetical protein n=1 Tax=Nocardiopsis protaetiae TaxID=3382270 RepID=UPI00387B40D4
MGRPRPCACGCGRVGRIKGRGLAKTCYDQARYRGQLHHWPLRLPGGGPIGDRSHQARADRLDDYTWLREQGATRDQAREQLAVSDRTISRYHRQLRQAGRRDPWLYDMPTNIYNRLDPDQKRETAA